MTEPFVSPIVDMTPLKRIGCLYDRKESELKADPHDIMLRNANRVGVRSLPEHLRQQKLKDMAFDELCLKLASDLYHHFFDNMIPHYLIDKDIQSPVTALVAPSDPLDYFRPVSLAASAYAKKILPQLGGFEQRVIGLSSLDDVEFLFGAAAYCKLIKTEDTVQRLRRQILDPSVRIGDAFVASMLYLHKDFLQCMEGK